MSVRKSKMNEVSSLPKHYFNLKYEIKDVRKSFIEANSMLKLQNQQGPKILKNSLHPTKILLINIIKLNSLNMKFTPLSSIRDSASGIAFSFH